MLRSNCSFFFPVTNFIRLWRYEIDKFCRNKNKLSIKNYTSTISITEWKKKTYFSSSLITFCKNCLPQIMFSKIHCQDYRQLFPHTYFKVCIQLTGIERIKHKTLTMLIIHGKKSCRSFTQIIQCTRCHKNINSTEIINFLKV